MITKKFHYLCRTRYLQWFYHLDDIIYNILGETTQKILGEHFIEKFYRFLFQFPEENR